MAKKSSKPQQPQQATNLLSELQSIPVTNQVRGRWEDELPPARRKEVDEIKAAMKAGKVRHSQAAVHRFLRERGVIGCSVGSFRNYLERP